MSTVRVELACVVCRQVPAGYGIAAVAIDALICLPCLDRAEASLESDTPAGVCAHCGNSAGYGLCVDCASGARAQRNVRLLPPWAPVTAPCRACATFVDPYHTAGYCCACVERFRDEAGAPVEPEIVGVCVLCDGGVTDGYGTPAGVFCLACVETASLVPRSVTQAGWPAAVERLRARDPSWQLDGCSFCPRTRAEVDVLVSGPTVAICGGCAVRLTAGDVPVVHEIPRREASQCSFCGVSAGEYQTMFVSDEASICVMCLDLVDDIVGEFRQVTAARFRMVDVALECVCCATTTSAECPAVVAPNGRAICRGCVDGKSGRRPMARIGPCCGWCGASERTAGTLAGADGARFCRGCFERCLARADAG